MRRQMSGFGPFGTPEAFPFFSAIGLTFYRRISPLDREPCVRQLLMAHRLAGVTAACRVVGIRSGHAPGAVDRVAVQEVFR
jgi:hypothetical protein